MLNKNVYSGRSICLRTCLTWVMDSTRTRIQKPWPWHYSKSLNWIESQSLVPSLRVWGIESKKKVGQRHLGIKTWIYCLQNKFRLTEKLYAKYCCNAVLLKTLSALSNDWPNFKQFFQNPMSAEFSAEIIIWRNHIIYLISNI